MRPPGDHLQESHRSCRTWLSNHGTPELSLMQRPCSWCHDCEGRHFWKNTSSPQFSELHSLFWFESLCWCRPNFAVQVLHIHLVIWIPYPKSQCERESIRPKRIETEEDIATARNSHQSLASSVSILSQFASLLLNIPQSWSAMSWNPSKFRETWATSANSKQAKPMRSWVWDFLNIMRVPLLNLPRAIWWWTHAITKRFLAPRTVLSASGIS